MIRDSILISKTESYHYFSLEEREMIRQEKMLSTKPIYAYENKQKKKEKKFRAKMRAKKRQQKRRKKEKLDSGMYGLEDF